MLVGIETDRGPWVRALLAAGYQVYAVNPMQAARYRERRSVSGAKSDKADAHALADMVRTDRHQLRQVAGDSEMAEAVKVVARAHQTLIWERTRHTAAAAGRVAGLLPRRAGGLQGPDRAGRAGAAGQGTRPGGRGQADAGQISAALKARRRDIAAKAAAIQHALRAEHLGQPPRSPPPTPPPSGPRSRS